jgi:hypothetical protein
MEMTAKKFVTATPRKHEGESEDGLALAVNFHLRKQIQVCRNASCRSLPHQHPLHTTLLGGNWVPCGANSRISAP